MLKVCSFFPAATSMIQQLGLEEHLVGVTFECPSDKPAVVRSHIEGNKMSSLEINTIVAEYNKAGKSLYYIDIDMLEAISPDIILTQGVCEICQISDNYVRNAILQLSKKPEIIPLTPKSLTDIFNDSADIAKALQKPHLAEVLFEKLNKRIHLIRNKTKGITPKKIAFIEWLDPLYNCGHWIPDQIKIAGGTDELSNPYGYSKPMHFKKLQAYNPEIIVFAPCGFNTQRTLQEIDLLQQKEGWFQLNAVINNEVYIANADLFTQPSTTLIEGIEILANIIHPQLFSFKQYQDDYININEVS